jgi:hypothetical protein
MAEKDAEEGITSASFPRLTKPDSRHSTFGYCRYFYNYKRYLCSPVNRILAGLKPEPLYQALLFSQMNK